MIFGISQSRLSTESHQFPSFLRWFRFWWKSGRVPRSANFRQLPVNSGFRNFVWPPEYERFEPSLLFKSYFRLHSWNLRTVLGNWVTYRYIFAGSCCLYPAWPKPLISAWIKLWPCSNWPSVSTSTVSERTLPFPPIENSTILRAPGLLVKVGYFSRRWLILSKLFML